jgi:hypothetical protein
VAKAQVEIKEADIEMKEAEPEAPQKNKRPAAIVEEPPKKQQKTLPNDIPRAKRTTKSGAPCFKGCVFVRTGRFSYLDQKPYEKAFKALVESYGGEFTKNANKATHCLDASGETFTGGIANNIQKVLANGGAAVPLPVEFKAELDGDEADAAYLAKIMEISEAIAKQEFRENVPLQHYTAALAKALLKDSDFLSRSSSACPFPLLGGCIETVQEKAKKLLESLEATPSPTL